MKKFTSQEIKEFVTKPLFDSNIILKKDSTLPKISIVTPSLNQGEFLEKTILSVLNQNYPNLEYIIIDGGSKDNSLEIIKKYQKYLAYWVSEPDKGQADAINKGFLKSTGDILTWLNSDDLLLPDCLFKIAKEFSKNSKIDIIFGNAYIIDEEEEIILEARSVPLNYKGLIYFNIEILQPGVFFRREIFFKVGKININYFFSFDLELFLKYILHKKKFFFKREFLGAFRIHKKSKTWLYAQIGRQEHLKILQEYKYKINKTYLKVLWIIIQIRRFFYFFVQGDFFYAIKKIINKINKLIKEFVFQKTK